SASAGRVGTNSIFMEIVSLSAGRWLLPRCIGPFGLSLKAKDKHSLSAVNHIYSHPAQDGWT
ncbi:MAG TPA: hypothetical protein PKK17_04085, partial [Sphingorhabdus lacus]|nr:hypothetical protein [Sphingorhabdus lacus]